MDATAEDVRRWVRGLESAARRAADEARAAGTVAFAEALDRVDDLRDTADALGATADPHGDEDNLAFHLTWARVRRACGVG